ncbi:MAG: ABC transporter permease [Candidatus Saccharibacteria bacterium]
MFKTIYKGLQMTGQFYFQELRAIRKDSGAILILIGALIIYPMVYAFAYKNEVVRELKTIIVDLDHSSASRQLVKMLQGAEQIEITGEAASMDEARKTFFEGNTGGIVVIPQHFEKDILNGKQTHVPVYADGSYFLIYRQVLSGAVKTIGTFSAGVEIKKLMMENRTYEQAVGQRDPLPADIHFWFNPSSGYGSFVMPGMIIIILQQTLLIGIGMVGGTARETKRESFMVPETLKKGGVFPIVFGKMLSYLTLYAINCLITMLWLHKWFGYPDHASFLSLMVLILPFLLSVIFLGITLSVLFKRRESALIFMVFLSPIVLFLSGISWPVSSIPPVVYQLAHVFPSTLMIPAYLRLRTMGAGLHSVSHEYWMMLIQMGIYFCTAVMAYYFSSLHNARKAEKQDELTIND